MNNTFLGSTLPSNLISKTLKGSKRLKLFEFMYPSVMNPKNKKYTLFDL